MTIYDIATGSLILLILGFFFAMAISFTATAIENIRDKDYTFVLCSISMIIVCLSVGIIGIGLVSGDIKLDSNKCERCIK